MKPTISIIVAMAKNRVIGKDNDMPWGRLPVDLAHFKRITEGHTVIMGRKTFDSIGKPLPNRKNIVITSKDSIDGCEVAHSIEQAISLASEEKEVFIIGGGTIYAKALDIADKFYLTFISMDTEGDTYFPKIDHFNLKMIDYHSEKKNENNKYDCDFITYKRLTSL